MAIHDWAFLFVLAFIVVTIGMLALALIGEALNPLWKRVVEGRWYQSMSIGPSVQTVSRHDTAKLYQAMRSVKSKMMRDGRHILSNKLGKKS